MRYVAILISLALSFVCMVATAQERKDALFIGNDGELDVVVSVRSTRPGARAGEMSVFPGERRRILVSSLTNYNIRIKVFTPGGGWIELGADDIPLHDLAAADSARLPMVLQQWRVSDGVNVADVPGYPPFSTVNVIGGNGKASFDIGLVGYKPKRPPVIP
ncbi:hypothetical protein NA78x_001735 [Anatilimnocola sp. NA78]|uniref:hypothetical protein n=1 Tax=Anatilimnocola sp. NA78 TaxID=3415683 RepID=UPI003CE57089